MADDDAAPRGARGTARGGRPSASQSTMGEAVAAAKKASRKAPTQPAPAAAKRPGTKKAAAAPTGARKAPAAAVAAKGAASKKAAPVTRKAPAAKKASAAKAAATGSRSAKSGAVLAGRSPAKKATARKSPGARLAAEQTFDDDWDVPAPPPERVREDPNARIRGVLRAAARSLEAREHAPASAVPPVRDPEPETPTRVLIAPSPPIPTPPMAEPEAVEPEAVEDDEVEEDEVEGPTLVQDEVVEDEAVEEEVEEEGEWAPPDVIEAEEPDPPAARPTSTEPAPPLWRPPAQSGATPPPPPPAAAPATATPPSQEPAKAPATSERRAGAGVPVLAIVLAVVVPLVGAVIGFVLANRARRRHAPLANLARVVAVLAFVGWLVGGGLAANARRDRGIDYSKLKVGDCFNSSSTNQVRGVKVIPCSKSHDSEIFSLVTHPAAKGAAYPGKDQLVQFAADSCLGQPLTDYLGIPLEQSKLKDFEIVPQSSAWKDGRRVLVCGIDTGGQGRITGSVKGSRR